MVSRSSNSFGKQLSTLFRSDTWSAQVLVWGLRAVTPLSWVYVLWSVYSYVYHSGEVPRTPRLDVYGVTHVLALSYACLEVPFSLYYRWLAHRIQVRQPFGALKLDFLREVLVKSLESSMSDDLSAAYDATIPPSFVQHKLDEDDPRAIDFRKEIRAWFLMASFDQIRRENVRDWILWSFFSSTQVEFHKSATPEQRDFVEETLTLLEARGGRTIPEGRNPAVKSLRLTIDPVLVTQRPLLLYAAVNAIAWLVVRKCQRQGFHQEREGDFDFLVRPAPFATGKNPIVFLHGLGIGLGQYSDSLHELATNRHLLDRTIVVVRQPHISQQIFHPRFLRPPGRVEFVENLSRFIKRKGYDGPIDVLSHSNGTSLLAWILKTTPYRLKLGRLVFVDPVCFCLWEPTIPYSFLYAPPTSGIEILMRFFVARELGAANALQRYYDWTSNLLWAEEVPELRDPKRTLIVLAGQDMILDAPRVRRYLCAHGVKEMGKGGNLLYSESAAHGEALTADGPIMRSIAEWMSGVGQ